MNRIEEVSAKLKLMRQSLSETESAGIRLRGTDWFAWATAGGSNTVLLGAETGAAEVLVTPTDAWILTDEIEAQRLKDEQLPHVVETSPYQLFVHPWAEVSKRNAFVLEAVGGGRILSDKPSGSFHDRTTLHEYPLPQSLIKQRRVLLPSELERYRQVGRLASEAMTEVLLQAQPTWTEQQLAGAGARAMWARGLHPVLTLAGGDRRLPLYRHPLPSAERLGWQAMLVFCARGSGLVASLTRFVWFDSPSAQDKALHCTIAEIEAIALERSQVEVPLNAVYAALAQTYEQYGYANAIREHHQGGTAGYGAREVIATPETSDRLAANMVLAWNPSIPGAKIEDTFVLHDDNRLENISLDPQFPHQDVNGRPRPIPLER
ncbi:M24 family metallopeptidase [Leptolyngbya sp. AN02str]|uniref:M24 family metallopeptidase n=1 Tax=Leptolyngbya sp. AN02str TaxID=3423363 RepID=UPI003D323A83